MIHQSHMSKSLVYYLLIIIIYFIMIVLHAHYSTRFTQFLLAPASFLGDKIDGIWIYQYHL